MLGPFRVLARPLTLPPRETAPGPADSSPAGPLAWWKFDETAGATAANAAGNRLQGQVRGQPHWASSASAPGGALEFDGIANGVEAADSTTLVFREGISVSAWCKLRQAAPGQTIAAKGEAWRLQCQDQKGTLEFALAGPSLGGPSGMNPAVLRSKRAINDGQWHHVAVTYDGKRMALCLDGTEEASVKTTGSLVVNNVPVTLGENDAVPGKPFDGWMRDVRLYNRGLSAEEVQGFSSKEKERASTR
jgi:hypothetical protein